MHMTADEHGSQRQSLVKSLSSQFHSHAYPVSRKEAIDIGLPVNKARDNELEGLLWKLWLDLEDELQERKPFDVIGELLSSSQAPKLLSPVPQLDTPASVPGHADLGQISKTENRIDPIDFEHVDALMESQRIAYKGFTKGKIIAARMPDLNLNFNYLISSRGWTKAY
jgi:hypothetical protein